MAKLPSVSQFVQSEEGSGSIFSMFLIAMMGMIGAAAVDISWLYSDKAQLQITADAVAHAALYNRETMTADDARAAALQIALSGMPEDIYGTVLTNEDIDFGTFDYTDGTFTVDQDSRAAVRVRPHQLAEDGNAARSFLFNMIGVKSFDVRAEAIYSTYLPTCFREGFVAESVVDIQSNNSYLSGFCIHSNTYVSMNSNNYFEPGTIVSMPDQNDIDLPQSGFKTNDGLQAALRSGTYRLRVLGRIDDIIAGVQTWGSEFVPDYITQAGTLIVSGGKVDVDSFIPGRIHRLDCTGGKTTIGNGTTSLLHDVVVVTDCEVKFANGLALENVVFATNSLSTRSFNSSSGLRLGRDDNCSEGGGAQLVTRGGVNVASDLQMYGGQILAMGNVNFAANADGIEGASIISNGEINGTSNMNMGFCNAGMEDNFSADYFRLAR